MVRSGIWRMISGDTFTSFRHGLLFNPGEGAPHRVRIDIRGEAQSGEQEALGSYPKSPIGNTGARRAYPDGWSILLDSWGIL